MSRCILFLASLLLFLLPAGKSQKGPGGVGGQSTNPVWLDASSLSLSNGDPVDDWSDISGNGNNASQGNNSRKPTFNTNATNGQPGILFDGSDDFLQTSSISALNSQNLTWINVFQSEQVDYYGTVHRSNYSSGAGNSSDSYWGFYFSGSGDGMFHFTKNSSGSFKIIGSQENTNYNISSSVWNGGSGLFEGFLNGSKSGERNNANSQPSGHNFTRIGCNSATLGTFFDGNISEIILISKTLNDAERIIIENYLASKYGISIVNDHYAYDGTHYRDVHGIGQESGGNNDIAQGKDIVEIKNPSSMGNGDYFLTGHDGQDTTWTSTETPAAYSNDGKRLQREWRVGETGEVGDLTLTFYLGSNDYGSPNKYEVLISSDNDFSSVDEQISGTWSASQEAVIFTDVPASKLNDGVYYTLGNNKGEVIESQNPTNWNDPNTWDCNCIPTAMDEVRVLHDGVTIGAAAEAGKLSIAGPASLTFNSADTLDIHGNFRIEGALNPGTGTVAFKADSGQSIDLNGNSPTFNNLHIANSSNTPVSFVNGGSQSVTIQSTGTVSFADGDLDVSGVNEFRLKSSSATQTARIGQIPSGSDLAGDVTLERQIDPGNNNAGWINVASPVGGTVEQMDGELPMSGKTGGGFSDGCAWSSSGCDYSVKKHDLDSSNGSVEDVINTGESMDRLKGFEMFIGDNTTSMNNSDSTDVFGGVADPGSLSKSFAGNWAFMGNPYCSDVSWDQIYNDNSGISSTYWVAAATGNYESYTVGGSVSAGVVNGDGTISSFQAIWVESTGASSFSIDQSHKVSGGDGFMKDNPKVYGEKSFGLHMTSKMNSYSCRSKVHFDAAASRKDDPKIDHTHRRAPAENAPELVFLSEDGHELRKQAIHPFDDEVTLPVIAKAGEPGTYKLEAENIDAIGQYDCIKLIDRRTREEHNLRETEEFQFDVQDTNDYSPRFDLVLSNEGNCKSATSLDEPDEQERIVKVLQNADGAELRFRLARKQEVRMTLYDITGRPVTDTRQVNARTHSERFQKPANAGIYMIVMETEEERITRRVKF